MENLHDLTDDEDFIELVNLVAFPTRNPRNVRNKENHFVKWNDNEFRARFRLSKETVHIILDSVREELSCLRNFNSAVTPDEMLLATLRYLATGSILQVIGDFSGMDKATASRLIIRVLRSIAAQSNHIVQMPSTERDMDKVKVGFYDIARFPKCIGAIDCTHVRIISPGGEQAEIFRNRKGFFSFNVQAVCESKLQIKDIVCRWPGSTHDSTIFNNSRLKWRIENGEFGTESILVGDSGYQVQNYLITPLLYPITHAENLFNESQIRTRNPIERCFGVLKKRFPVLALGIRLDISKVEAVVVACAVLHNVACQVGEPELEVDEEVWQAIRQTMNVNLDTYPNNPPRNFTLNDLRRYNLINSYFNNLEE